MRFQPDNRHLTVAAQSLSDLPSREIGSAAAALPGRSPASPLRVLHVIPSVSSAHGGPSKAILTMESALSALGVSVTTVTTDDDGPGRRFAGPPLAASGVTRIYHPKRTEFYKIAPELALWLWRNIGRFDLVHIHALFSFSSVAAAVLCAQQRVPYIVRPLGTLSPYGLARRRRFLKQLSLAVLEGPMLRGASAVHFTSEAEAEEARAALGRRLNGVVIPLGLDGLAESWTEQQQGATRKAAGQTILFMSRLDPKKNVEGLLEAFARIAPQWPHARLAIAGGGSAAYERCLHKRADDLGLNDSVEWLGHVEGAAKAAALGGADIFVLPSFSENFGIAAVEAMAKGLPCVLGRDVAVATQAERFGAACAVEPTAEVVAAALVRLLESSELRMQMGEAAARFSHENYSAQTMARRLVELYHDIRRGSGR